MNNDGRRLSIWTKEEEASLRSNDVQSTAAVKSFIEVPHVFLKLLTLFICLIWTLTTETGHNANFVVNGDTAVPPV